TRQTRLRRRSDDERLLYTATGAPQGGQEKKCGDYNTAIRKDITMPAVKCRRIADRNAPDHRLLSKDWRGVEHAAVRIDKSGNARVRGARKGDMVFHRAEDHHAEVLIGSRRIAEPGIVRNRDHKIRAIPHKFADKIGKDGLEANDHAEFSRCA